jgi:hypothetical protein
VTVSPNPGTSADPTRSLSPRRTRHCRPEYSPKPHPKPTPLKVSLSHAAELNIRAHPSLPARSPVLDPFPLTGGYKTTQASTISQKLTVTYLNVGGLTAHKLNFILEYMKQTETNVATRWLQRSHGAVKATVSVPTRLLTVHSAYLVSTYITKSVAAQWVSVRLVCQRW